MLLSLLLFVPMPPGPPAAATPPVLVAGEKFARLAPFTGVRFDGDTPHVRVDGVWYEARAIDGVEIERVVSFCHATYGSKWSKRFSEDLVEVFHALGAPLGDTVELELVDPETGAPVHMTDVTMTAEKRWEAWSFNNVRDEGPAVEPQRVTREHAQAPDPRFAELFELRPYFRGGELSADQVGEDLDELEWLLENRYSYLRRLDLDYAAALDTLRLTARDGFSLADFGLRLELLLALFGDGHARVAGTWTPESTGELPFLLAPCGDRTVAFLPDRSALVDPAAPYVVAMDGRPIDAWLGAMTPLVPRGAPHFMQFRAHRELRAISFAREQLGLPHPGEITLSLTGEDGRSSVDARLALTTERPVYGAWPRGSHRMLPGKVGYLRVKSMSSDPEFLNELRAQMETFRDTRGLVIDVRGNGGGSRAVLRLLLPYFMAEGEAPQVVNAATYRLGPGEERGRTEGYLENRWLYPRGASVWTSSQRHAIDAAARKLRPEWMPPEDEFSAMHYCVVDPAEAAWAYAYTAPVVVLLDGGCFSATDIFLGAFADRPNVTLVGTPSGGGSGRTRTYELAHSKLDVRLSSMVSYRPDGTLYDGRGIEPDVLVERVPTDLIGETDTQLDAALRSLER